MVSFGHCCSEMGGPRQLMIPWVTIHSRVSQSPGYADTFQPGKKSLAHFRRSADLWPLGTLMRPTFTPRIQTCAPSDSESEESIPIPAVWVT